MAKRISSAVLWQGASLLDGAPIVAIVTGLSRPSKNEKTGPMAQVFILRADVSPLNAIQTGADHSICGLCKHRGVPTVSFGQVTYSGRSCYVVVAQSPQAVYRAYRRGSYPVLEPSEIAPLLAGRAVRLGAYGDPAAVPAEVWRELTVSAKSHTGYTHQWDSARGADYRPFVMASVDTPAEYVRAQAAGWRTFRVRTAAETLIQGAEISCPASEEMGYRTTCANCGLCAGAEKHAKSIAILAHGNGVSSFVALSSLRN